MFGKDASSAGDTKLNSIIGRGSQCEGEIVVSGGLKIDGRFNGKIKADSVFVGKEAVVEATVETNVAVVGGKILGDVVARESLELQAKSELVGNVKTKNLIVGESAVLDGYCDMGQKERHAKAEGEKKASTDETKSGGPAGQPGTAVATPAPSGRTDKS
jgi:cytoskeletal protein CcmA (bactofilin family)